MKTEERKLLYVYRCPACNMIHKVYNDDVIPGALNCSIIHKCPYCGHLNQLWLSEEYWSDHQARLNPDIDILYGDKYEEYVKKYVEDNTEPVGYITVNSNRIPVYDRPNWFQKIILRLAFGIRYVNA